MKKIVLVGGCFDILHPGHISFLEKSKKIGDILIVLLESDEKIKKVKGANRPINTQAQRSLALKAFKFVDEVMLLPFIETEKDYNEIVKKIKPHIIATTYGDPNVHHKKLSAKLVGAKLKYVIKRIEGYSSSNLIEN